MNPLDEQMRSIVETDRKTEAEVDEEADAYMNIVFELCPVYECQRYIYRRCEGQSEAYGGLWE